MVKERHHLRAHLTDESMWGGGSDYGPGSVRSGRLVVPLRTKIMIMIMTVRTVMVMMMKMLMQIRPKNFDQLSTTHPDDTGGL